VLHRWQPGDVLVFDNIIAQHGRQPWEGEQSDRVVLVSLFDGDTVAGTYGSEEWAQVVQAHDG
jgi:alpha-ketoglutarate-dependent taurine dioxygenase